FDSTGEGLLAATYLGGTGNDAVASIAVRPDQPGKVYIAGTTRSDDFPLQDPYEGHPTAAGTATTLGFETDNAFVSLVDFNQTGADQLAASTYFGGGRGDEATDIALDEDGRVYVVGQTNSLDLPTAAPLIPEWQTGPLIRTAFPSYAHDHFIAEFDAALTA